MTRMPKWMKAALRDRITLYTPGMLEDIYKTDDRLYACYFTGGHTIFEFADVGVFKHGVDSHSWKRTYEIPKHAMKATITYQ